MAHDPGNRKRSAGKATRIVALAATWMALGATDQNTWYAYCEGRAGGRMVAVFSDNFWTHSRSTEYIREVGELAQTYFEARHGMRLAGCTGVGFRHAQLADYSRARTIRLHTEMGDRIEFFHLPGALLPEELEVPAENLVSAEPHPAEPGLRQNGRMFEPTRGGKPRTAHD